MRYDEQAIAKQAMMKNLFETIETCVDTLPNGRAKSLVYTTLEEAYM